MKSVFKSTTIALALVSLTANILASESDELKTRAKELQLEAKKLVKDGHAEKAADLKREAHKLLEQADRQQKKHRPEKPQQLLFKLNLQLEILRGQQRNLELSLEAEHREERLAELLAAIQETEAEIRRISQERHEHVLQEQTKLEPEHRPQLIHRPRPVHHPELIHRGDQLHPHNLIHHPELHPPEIHQREHGPRQEIARRLEHMRIAIENLNMAGLHDIAGRVAERAEAAEAELHQHAEPHKADSQHALIEQLEEMRHEMARLREEVRQLKQ